MLQNSSLHGIKLTTFFIIEFKIECDIVTKSDLGVVNIKRVLKGSGTGKITKILNNDNFLI
ncbi:18708_t:CDS:1, partial [Gigaspora rosea]